MPSPIAIVNTGTTTTLAFPNEGKFGYHCANHPLVMKGAIWVIP
jgi:plastocyanin